MDRVVKISAITLILAHVLGEVHGFIWDFYPKIETTMVDPFWSKSFHMQMSLQWYIKDLSDEFSVVLFFYVMAKIALQYSVKLYMICLIYFFYHVCDAMLFMYDYKQDYKIYMVLLYGSIIATLFLIVPEKEKMYLVK